MTHPEAMDLAVRCRLSGSDADAVYMATNTPDGELTRSGIIIKRMAITLGELTKKTTTEEQIK
jgi:hypothetical protein